MHIRHYRTRLRQRKLAQGIMIVVVLLVVVGFLALCLYLR